MRSAVWLVCLLMAVVHSAAEEPARCCMDNQFSAVLGDVGAVGNLETDSVFFLDGYIQMNYDYYRDRQSTNTTARLANGTYINRFQIKDYENRLLYAVNDDGCTYTDLHPLDVMRPACIPDHATYGGLNVLGYGLHSLKVHSWKFNMPVGPSVNLQVTMTVTKDHCVPVAENIIANFNNTVLEMSLFYTGYHPGIENLDDMNIPDNCQPAKDPTSSPLRRSFGWM